MYERRRLVIRTWSRFFMRTSGSIAARSDGWYICFIGSNSSGRPRSEETERARRPLPVDRGRGGGEGAAPARLGGAEDEDPVGLRRPARLVAPQLRHLPIGGHVVEGDPGEAIAQRLSRRLPDPLREPDRAPDGPAPVELDVADDEDDDRVVGQDVSQPL